MPLTITTYGNVVKAAYTGTQKGVLKTVIAGSAQAKALAPVDLGELRNSVGYSAEVSGRVIGGGYNQSGGERTDTFLESKGKGLEGYYGSALDYAPYVENGTRRMVAQPFLEPSAEILKGTKTAEEVKKELNETMQQEVRSGTKATRRVQ